jgi:alkylation response protein AidB-like acyl-CoA dehydrogenase
LHDVRLPDTAVLPGAEGLRGPFACLNEARYGIIWGSMGAARSCFEHALEYAREREQFGKPVAAFQLTQEKLVDMMVEIEKSTLLALHLGRMKDESTLRPEQTSFGKLNNVREATKIAREARTITRRQRRNAGLPGHVPREQPGERPYLRGYERGPHPHSRKRHNRYPGLPLARRTQGSLREHPHDGACTLRPFFLLASLAGGVNMCQ